MSGEMRLCLTGHKTQVNTIALLPNGDLVSGSFDQTLKIWNLESGVLKTTLRGHSHTVSSLAILSGNRIASGSGDNSVKIWNYWLSLVSGREHWRNGQGSDRSES